MKPLKKNSRILNIVLFLVMIGFLAYYIAILFGSGSSTTDTSYVYHDMKWIGMISALTGTIIGYAGIGRSSAGSILRGVTVGFVIGLSVLTIVVLTLAP